VANKLDERTVAANIGKESFMKQAQGYQCVSKHEKIRKRRWKFNSKLIKCNKNIKINKTALIRHQCRKTTVLSCHICLIKNGAEKNEQHLNID
jgi:hypothetical protein